MPEFAFLDPHNRQLRSINGGGGGGGRDVSPDSVVYSVESSLSLFSSSASATASLARCSSASNIVDHDASVSDMSLSGGFNGSSSARSSDPDPNKKSTGRNNGRPYLTRKKVEKAEVYINAENDGENPTLYSARSSFSQSIKECQNRKSKTEILLRKPDRRRFSSLDLNNQTMNPSNTCSPRLGVSMKTSISSHRNIMFPSTPGTPNYHHTTITFPKGWSSERVPSHTNPNRFPLLPYNNNGRTLPSKWEDAERWIISPVALKPSIQQPQRRPKSKSGPLGPSGSNTSCSPVTPNFEGENRNDLRIQNKVNADSNCLGQYKDDKIGGLTDSSTDISCDVSRRDTATQMSPESSCYSSKRNSSSMSSTILSKADIRDVQVDGHVTLTRWSKKIKGRIPGRWSDFLDARSADWEPSEITKSLSKVKREEAKITAWENLQKAKAEASIRKLEMKLEKKRSSSMDRIMNKLKTAQKKAQEMRESNKTYKVARSSHKAISLIKTRHIRSLTGCFTCPTF